MTTEALILPPIALSVRQPWAWAIIHAGKNVENRTSHAVYVGGMRRSIGREIAIHASKGMSGPEYASAQEFMASIGVTCPRAGDLERGGIIGTVTLKEIVTSHASPWFFGPMGLVLADAVPVPFIGAVGQLGIFTWFRNGNGPDKPARWMLKTKEALL